MRKHIEAETKSLPFYFIYHLFILLRYIYTGWHIQQSGFTIWSCGVNTPYKAGSNNIRNMNYLTLKYSINTLRPRQNGRHFADDIFKCIFLNENAWISLKFSLKFVPKGPINNNPALVQIMAWRRSGDKPLSEPMMIGLPTHICVTRPQWVKTVHTQI